MRLPLILLCAMLLAGPARGADVLAGMQGEWQGGEIILSLDFERDQARTDPARPFGWQRLSVKSIDGRRVVFAVGTRIYTATLEGDALAVRIAGETEPRLLQRVEPGEPAATASLGDTEVAEPPPEGAEPEPAEVAPGVDPDQIAEEAEANDMVAGPPDAEAEDPAPPALQAAPVPAAPSVEDDDRFDYR